MRRVPINVIDADIAQQVHSATLQYQIRPSVRSSVTHWYWVKTNELRIMRFPPPISPVVLVLTNVLQTWRNFDGVLLSEVLSTCGVQKCAIFSQYVVITRKQ